MNLEQSLRYHAARFSASRKSKVLRRYCHAVSYLKGKELIRHACHVCAWCALLDTDTVLRREGPAAISPLHVLERILHVLRKTKRLHWGTRLITHQPESFSTLEGVLCLLRTEVLDSSTDDGEKSLSTKPLEHFTDT